MAVWLRTNAAADPAVWFGVNNAVSPADVEFNFTPSFGNPLSTPVVSNVATVTGPDGDYPVILSGDASLEVSIDAGPFTNSPANFVIPTNTTIQARLTSSASYQALVQGTVQIDTASENFDVYTQKDPSAVGGFAGGMSLGMGVGLTKIKYNAKAGTGFTAWNDNEAWIDSDPWND